MTVGVLGAGQLGRMLALAGYPLGLDFVFLDPARDAAAGRIAPQIAGAFDDPDCLRELARRAEVVTYEFENVPARAVQLLAGLVPVRPPSEALAFSQDRLAEKRLFRELGIPTVEFAEVNDLPGLRSAIARLGLPAILKARREGYDGKGQVLLEREEEVEAAWSRAGGRPLLLESAAPFAREVSLLGVRSTRGETSFYPLVENHHADGILRWSLAPAPGGDTDLAAQASEAGERLMARLGYAGVLAVEFFEVEGRLIANEMAPRVHNSGHWTIEGAETSQFENHLRAILGLPLGSTALRGRCAMVNLVGDIPPLEALMTVPGARVHLYGKQVRPGRKVGHVTVVASDEPTLRSRLGRVFDLVPGARAAR